MADIPALLLAIVTVAGGGSVLVTHSSELPGMPISEEIAMVAPPVAHASAHPAASKRTVIPRQEDGLFYIDAMVNGAKVHFLIDTGSNMVVLAPQDAARAGVVAGSPASILNTAAGPTSSALTQIEHISIAGRELHDIGAEVPSAGLSVSLLGQNVLTELGDLRMSHSTLTVG